jgi:hypothetical protein
MRKIVSTKKSEFDIKCTLILANRKLSLDDKAKAILNLKKIIGTTPTRKRRF